MCLSNGFKAPAPAPVPPPPPPPSMPPEPTAIGDTSVAGKKSRMSGLAALKIDRTVSPALQGGGNGLTIPQG